MINLPTLKKLPLSLRIHAISVIPNVLRPTLNLLPFSVQKSVLLSVLHVVFNEALDDGDFDFLQGKWLRICVSDLSLNWWLSFKQGQLLMMSKKEQINEDVCFTATGDDLLLIAGRKQDPDTLFFQRKLTITGDTELGLEVKNLIDAIDIEQLPSMAYTLVEYFASLIDTTNQEKMARKYSNDHSFNDYSCFTAYSRST